MKPKILFTDVDFTVTDAEGRIYLPAVEIIRKLTANEIRTVLVSGMPCPFLKSLSHYIGVEETFVSEQSAVIVLDGKLHLLGSRKRAEQGFLYLKSKFNDSVRENVWDMFCLANRIIDRIIPSETLQESLDNSEFNDLHIQDSGVALHLLEKKLNKGFGADKVIKHYSFDKSECIAVGDGYADLTMLDSVAYFVAVGNSPKPVKDLAAYTTKKAFGAGFVEFAKTLL